MQNIFYFFFSGEVIAVTIWFFKSLLNVSCCSSLFNYFLGFLVLVGVHKSPDLWNWRTFKKMTDWLIYANY